MVSLTITQLDPIKLPLIKRMYKAHYPSGKAKSDELILVGQDEKSMCCCVRFKTIEQYRLLTGMLVIPSHRSLGVGHQLLDYCQEKILQSTDYCFAYTHLEGMYQSHGFHTVEQDELPNPLRNLYERYTRHGKALIAMQYEGNIT
ncbi:GNAT family N-acetyltransferase [Vibrio maerlii]|uniref:GNAT family N-acetyltransferase n=1 Tax=Vibrio maerlii TaxID=2231648 RepID=UPI000E3DC03C|nr:GNAT family N-acetyltransferase [Vibrio maerlii]